MVTLITSVPLLHHWVQLVRPIFLKLRMAPRGHSGVKLMVTFFLWQPVWRLLALQKLSNRYETSSQFHLDFSIFYDLSMQCTQLQGLMEGNQEKWLYICKIDDFLRLYQITFVFICCFSLCIDYPPSPVGIPSLLFFFSLHITSILLFSS